MSSGKPRSVRAVLVVAAAVVVLVLATVVLPVWGLTSSADASTAGAPDVPVGRIAVVAVLGVLVVVALVAGLLVTARPTVARVLTAVITVAALLTALYPLLATARPPSTRARSSSPG